MSESEELPVRYYARISGIVRSNPPSNPRVSVTLAADLLEIRSSGPCSASKANVTVRFEPPSAKFKQRHPGLLSYRCECLPSAEGATALRTPTPAISLLTCVYTSTSPFYVGCLSTRRARARRVCPCAGFHPPFSSVREARCTGAIPFGSSFRPPIHAIRFSK